ncbi:MAG: putative tricarboxylic transport membrane protein [Rhodoferax sp.]|jgi:putative tricarboxylic transport membrane protein
MSDRIFGITALLLAAVMTWGASVIQESFIQDPLGPKAFPWVIAAVLAITGITMMLKPDDEPEWPARTKFLRIVWSVTAMVLYAEVLPIVGFVITTAAVAAFLSWQLGATLRQAAMAGALISGGIFVVFHLVLGLSLARGPLGF